MRAGRLSAAHLRIAGVGYVALGVLVLVKTGSFALAAGVILGPFAGGVAHGWRSCCAGLSLSLAPFGVLLLAIGLGVQRFVAPSTPRRAMVRRAVWALSTAGWFTLAVVSYRHVLA